MITVNVPYSIERDEDGVWCARADLGPYGVAFSDGLTEEEAVAELQEAVLLVADDEPGLARTGSGSAQRRSGADDY